MRISLIVVILIVYFYKVTINPSNNSWYTNPGLLAIIFIIGSEIVSVIMEWKYSPNQKRYILTISELIFIMIFLWLVLKGFTKVDFPSVLHTF